jgi:exodeoxyribonuclease VII large subunit
MERRNKSSQQTLSSLSSMEGQKNIEDESSEKKTPSTGDNTVKLPPRTHVSSGGELTYLGGAKIYSITEITKLIKDYLENNESFNNIWLRGEISNFTKHRSEHMYFDLKDENCIVSCVMFRSANQQLKFKPEHGMKVLGFGNINVYPPHGKYQFILGDLLPDGLGALHMAYLQLKEKLSIEGLFALEHKRPIPRFPKVIGVVTSPTGAAIRDIIRVATRRFPGINILISPSKVQGENSVEELINGLEQLQKIGGVDVIIIGRGGGSLEDLWAFNEEPLARAIYNTSIPVISAVGHETDYTIADFVADVRAPTPSAAAELAVPDKSELIQLIITNMKHIKQNIDSLIKNNRIYLQRLMESPVLIRPKERINYNRQILDNLTYSLNLNFNNYFSLTKSKLDANIGKLSALDPRAILNRGYTMTLKLPEESLVSTVRVTNKDEKLKIILKDGEVKCRVEEVIQENEKLLTQKKDNK